MAAGSGADRPTHASGSIIAPPAAARSRTVGMSSVPKVRNVSSTAQPKPTSATALTRNAFVAARPAAARWPQCEISRYEQIPIASQHM